MKKIIAFFEKYFVPVAAKIGNQRHLVAIRDGFVAIMPLILVGAFGILVNNLQIPGYQTLMRNIFGVTGETAHFTSFGSYLWDASYGIMSLVLCIALSYNLAKSYESDALAASITSFAALFMLYDKTKFFEFAGATGLFVAMIMSIIATEMFVRLLRNKKLNIKMPDSVPPAVSRSFAALLPGVLVLIVFSLLKCLLVTIGVSSLHQLVYDAIQQPLQGMAQGLGTTILIAFLIHLLWFFGLHGANILLPITTALYQPAMEQNMKLVQNGQLPDQIITPAFFDNFIYLGGTGATLGLLIAVFIASKKKKSALMEQYKTVSGLSSAPGIFNINEPVLFGMPIVLNPILIIPFLITPIILVLVTYFAMTSGLVPLTIMAPHWTMPPVIGAALATNSISGGVLAAINLVISIVIYLPFVFMGHDEKVVVDDGLSQ